MREVTRLPCRSSMIICKGSNQVNAFLDRPSVSGDKLTLLGVAVVPPALSFSARAESLELPPTSH